MSPRHSQPEETRERENKRELTDSHPLLGQQELDPSAASPFELVQLAFDPLVHRLVVVLIFLFFFFPIFVFVLILVIACWQWTWC